MRLSLLTILTLLSLGAVGIVGFLWLSLADYSGPHLCPFSPMTQGGCPNSALALAMHHLSSLQSLSQAIIGVSLNLLILAIFLLSFWTLMLDLSLKPLLCSRTPFQQRQLFLENLFFSTKKTLRWLSLLRKRDPALRDGRHGLT